MTPEEQKIIREIVRDLKRQKQECQRRLDESLRVVDVATMIGLLEPLIKWEPKEYTLSYAINVDGSIDEDENSSYSMRLFGNEFPTEELAIKARDMNKRNQLILQAKTEMGYGDGECVIEYTYKIKQWESMLTGHTTNAMPELTFKTEEQAEHVISMLGLNDE